MKISNELRDRAHAIAKAHGFHNEKQEPEHFLMLVITEIAEMVEADRKDFHASGAGQSPHYVCGMSVPPIMIAQVASQIWEQWLSKI